MKVGGGEHDVLTAFFEVCGQFTACGRFSGTLKAAHHDDGGAGLDVHDVGIDRPHQVDEMIVDDLDHLLAGLQGGEYLGADGLFHDVIAEFFDNIVVHIGFEKGRADFLHGLADVGFRDFAATGEVSEDIGEFVS